jgi:HK97 family phage major capsid protein
MTVQLDITQSLHREKDIQDELERLKGKKDKTDEDRGKVPALLEEFRMVHAHRLDLEHDEALAEIRSAGTPPATEGGGETETRAQVVDRRSPEFISGKYRDPYNLAEVRFSGNVGKELRNRALDAVERMEYVNDPKVRETVAMFVERDGSRDSEVAKMVLATTSPDYMSAFISLMRSQGQAACLMPNEAGALHRAMSLTDNAGGYLVPTQLDPNIINTASGSVNQVRQIARVVNATGDVWYGVSSAGVTGSWDAEAAEVSDDAPTLAQPSIAVHKAQIFVPLSFEVQEDAPNIANEVGKMIAFEKDRLESIAFVTGSGSGQPTGIVTALTGGAQVVASLASDTFAVADVHALDAALPQRWAANASWLAHRAIYSRMRQFDTGGGASLWGFLSEGRKADLLGRPDYVSEAMDSSITALADNLVLIFGDFSNYVVVDRLGTRLSYIPHLFGANGRPTGQSGWHAYVRVGGDSVNDAAFRMLNVT